MKIIDPGHKYKLKTLDGYKNIILTFVKRIGAKYPGNESKPYAGTNIQEVLRVLINRLKYLQKQNPCLENIEVVQHLRAAIWKLEVRAARVHRRTPLDKRIIDHPILSDSIEILKVCKNCGHIGCLGDCH